MVVVEVAFGLIAPTVLELCVRTKFPASVIPMVWSVCPVPSEPDLRRESLVTFQSLL